MSELSRSPDRGTFQMGKYIKRKRELGEEPSQDYLDMYKNFAEQKLALEADPEWQKDNLEYDLRTTDWILEKVRSSEAYAQNLYAAMCNRGFQKNDTWPVLANQSWGCSWRYAGGIVADMRQEGDYIDWYCSGIRGDYQDEELRAFGVSRMLGPRPAAAPTRYVPRGRPTGLAQSSP